jgi:hypothetical protein
MYPTPSPGSSQPRETESNGIDTVKGGLPPLSLCLQWHGDGDPEEGEVCESEVTWSRERIFAHDIEYVSKAALQDPARTHAMMLRGEIAWESEKIRHLLGDGDLLDMLYRCEAWFSTLPEGRKMQLECQRVISLHND